LLCRPDTEEDADINKEEDLLMDDAVFLDDDAFPDGLIPIATDPAALQANMLNAQIGTQQEMQEVAEGPPVAMLTEVGVSHAEACATAHRALGGAMRNATDRIVLEMQDNMSEQAINNARQQRCAKAIVA
jgi:hypothetical protein